MTVLATDLDGTFAHGSPDARARLVESITGGAGRLIYVTGRTAGAAIELAERTPLPEPDVLICDVGTSVLRGLGPERVEAIESALDGVWPGGGVVRERLRDLEEAGDLVPQDIDTPRRESYWVEPVRRLGQPAAADDDPFAARSPDDASLGTDAEELAAAVAARAAERLEGLDVDVVVSANVFLDVLPRGVNKGTTLRRVLEWLEIADDECVVAGDSLNDLALFDTGLRGVAVGNCEPGLRRRVAGMAAVYQAAAHGVEGIAEGLRYHGRGGRTPANSTDRSNRGDGHGE